MNLRDLTGFLHFLRTLFLPLLLTELFPYSYPPIIYFFSHLICTVTDAFYFILHLISWIPQLQSFISDSFFLINFNIFLFQNSFCSLILFLDSLSEYPYNLLNFFITANLNSLSVRFQYSMTFLSGEISFSFCDIVLSWFLLCL